VTTARAIVPAKRDDEYGEAECGDAEDGEVVVHGHLLGLCVGELRVEGGRDLVPILLNVVEHFVLLEHDDDEDEDEKGGDA